MMKFIIAIIVLYGSPGCLSQCVNCAPQQSYQYVLNVPNYLQTPSAFSTNRTPCCIPPANVQTIQSARAFTNGAQGSQVIMYYNGQRIVAGPQTQPTQQVSNFDQSSPGNYQNPGPIPGYQNQNTGQTNQAQYPNNLNGGVQGGVQGGPLEVGQNVNTGYQGQNINAGGNVDSQNQNVYTGGNIPPNQNQNINAGGYVGDNQNQGQGSYAAGNDPQNSDQNINAGGYVGNQNQNGNQFQNDQNNYQGSTLSPSGAEIGYQPFVPSGNEGYNADGTGNYYNGQEQYGAQPQNPGQNQYPQNGGIVAGGTVGDSYNSPNSEYVNSQIQPQTYPTQMVTGGSIPNQNLQQQPDVNTQYQDQTNNQPVNGQNTQGSYSQNQQGVQPTQNPQPIITGGQGQQNTTPNNQYGTQSTTPNYQQGQASSNQGFSTTPGYQQNTGYAPNDATQTPYFTPQQSTSGQPTFTNQQQGYIENTDVPVTNSPELQDSNTVESIESNTNSSPMTSPSPYPVIYPVPSVDQTTFSPPTTINPPMETVESQTSTVSPNQDGIIQITNSQNYETTSLPSSSTIIYPSVVPVPLPIPTAQNDSNGSIPLEATTETLTDNNGDLGFSSTPGTYPVGNNAQGQFTTDSYQSATPTTNYNGNTVTAGGQQQFQSTTGIPIANDGQEFMTSSTNNPNMPQAQYPSQQDILTYTGQSTAGSISGTPTPAPQFPSQQELGASTVTTPPPQFPAQQDMGAITTSSPQNNNFVNQQSTSGATPQFPSQQELIQRDQQQSDSGAVNNVGFTPQYNDMNTQYGHYSTSTASDGIRFDQPADQQQIQNGSGLNLITSFATILLVASFF